MVTPKRGFASPIRPSLEAQIPRQQGGATDVGLLAYCELDEAFALTEMVQDTFEESRIGSNKQHQLVLRQSIYS